MMTEENASRAVRVGRHHWRVPLLSDALAAGGPYRQPAVILLCVVAAVVLGIGVAVAGPLLFVLALVALAIGVALLTDPLYLVWSVLAVIVLLPFATIPVDIGVTPTFLEICIAGAFAVTIGQLGYRGRLAIAVSPVGWALLIFAGLAVFSFVAGVARAMPTVT